MNIFSIIFIYINIQYTFSLGSRDFFGAAPGLKLPRLPCVPLQCRCFPWPPVYGFDGDAARWPPGFAPQWFTGSQSSQRQLYGCNISWAQPREISATIHQFDPQKIRVCNKNNNFQKRSNDLEIQKLKFSTCPDLRPMSIQGTVAEPVLNVLHPGTKQLETANGVSGPKEKDDWMV